jgi:hypothetical protein
MCHGQKTSESVGMVQADLLKSSEPGEKKKNKKKIGGRTW